VVVVTCNLLDLEDTKKAFKGPMFSQATHLFHTAYKQSSDNNQMVSDNLTMLQNAVTTLDDVANDLRKVCLVTGSKYYGVDKGPYKTPAEESDERRQEPIFYYYQEDWLKTYQQGKLWNWTVIRPNEIIGYSHGFMNLGQALGTYAAICKEKGMKFKFPGSTKCWESLSDMSDAKYTNARMLEWAALDPVSARNQAFNCVNGDIFRWKYMWPKLANYFGLEYEGPGDKQCSLYEHLDEWKPVWDTIVQKHNLKKYPLEKISSFDFADNFTFRREWDAIHSMNKAREAGFKEWRNSETMFYDYFRCLQKLGVIPETKA